MPLCLLLLPLVVSLQAAPTGASASPDELARRLQAKYEQVRDFTADFEHAYEGGVLRKKVVERGRVQVKKPGKMRWTYIDPERKEFVSDGETLYSYMPEDKQVMVNRVPPADEASSPALFLAGKGDILRDFTASTPGVPNLGPNEVALRLDPRNPQQEYEWLVLALDRETLQIRRLITQDAQGGTSSFTFSRIRENVGLPDRTFTFTIPRGVDVITDAGQKR
ncbi:MAG TPA: outer membrane lipoprotein carrier protein LolA [Vicinamibacterales bacterium]|nr:outer membrane lipoprotein carrier protein LolA [Vicinamibacterales bacterium]